MNKEIVTHGITHMMAKRLLPQFWMRRMWLKKTETMSIPELHEIQLLKLRKLVTHCYRTVPYYRELMEDRGFKPRDIRTLDDIKLFPILTKQEILQAGSLIISRKYPRLLMAVGRTGGTTGTPLSIYRNIFSIATEHAFVRRQWDWAGIGFKDNVACLMGRVVSDTNAGDKACFAYDPFMRELILSTYHLSAKTAVDYIRAIAEHNVKAIWGYASSVCFLAKCCLEAGIDIRLKAALTTSETINEYMRDTIESAFKCKVFDFYGAAERVCYIFTCEEGKYHLIPEYGYTELIPVDPDYPEMRKVVATGFWNFAMPFIRYDIGDIVITSEAVCKCCRSFQVVESIVGRTGDIIQTPSGRTYGPTLLARVTKWANNVLETQVIQDSIDHLTIPFVPNDKFTPEDFEHFQSLMKQYMPEDLKIDLMPVASIDRTAGGKMKFIVSKI